MIPDEPVSSIAVTVVCGGFKVTARWGILTKDRKIFLLFPISGEEFLEIPLQAAKIQKSPPQEGTPYIYQGALDIQVK